MPIDSFRQRKSHNERKERSGGARPVKPAPPPAPVAPAGPQNYDPINYQLQLASMLSPGSQVPAPIQGQFPMPQYSPVQQPGFGGGQFNPSMGLFGSFAPQGGMFSGLFGGQQ